jgi:hypothetical protein
MNEDVTACGAGKQPKHDKTSLDAGAQPKHDKTSLDTAMKNPKKGKDGTIGGSEALARREFKGKTKRARY